LTLEKSIYVTSPLYVSVGSVYDIGKNLPCFSVFVFSRFFFFFPIHVYRNY
jgi:hypothetical protein